MPLRIAFDLDGVFADMHGVLREGAGAMFGAAGEAARPSRGIESVMPAAGPDLTHKAHRQLWRAVRATAGFWESLPEIEPGAIARLSAVAYERRWEVIFLTRRPPTSGDSAQLQSQRWLREHGFMLPSVYVVNGSRGRIASALGLDVVVDDTPDNCLDVITDSDASVIAVFRDASKAVPPIIERIGIRVTRSVAECLDVLCSLDSTTEAIGAR